MKTAKSQLRAAIFDFDGVLADSLPALLEVAGRLAKREGWTLPDATEIERMRDLDSRTVISRSGIPLRRLPSLIRRVRREMAGRAHALGSFPGLDQALRQLAENGFVLGIVTSNGDGAVERFLESHRWTSLFAGLETGSSLFGKSRLIRRWLDRRNIPANAAAYVGDETRDVEAARRCGALAVAAGWGYASEKALRETKPDRFVRTPAELPGALRAAEPPPRPPNETNP